MQRSCGFVAGDDSGKNGSLSLSVDERNRHRKQREAEEGRRDGALPSGLLQVIRARTETALRKACDREGRRGWLWDSVESHRWGGVRVREEGGDRGSRELLGEILRFVEVEREETGGRGELDFYLTTPAVVRSRRIRGTERDFCTISAGIEDPMGNIDIRIVDIIRVSYRLLLLDPKVFSELWDWSGFYDLVQHVNCPQIETANPVFNDLLDIRWCVIQMLSVVMRTSDRIIANLGMGAEEALCAYFAGRSIVRTRHLKKLAVKGALRISEHKPLTGNFVLTTAVKRSFEMVLMAASQKWPVLLYGPAGSGKTALINDLALKSGSRGNHCRRSFSGGFISRRPFGGLYRRLLLDCVPAVFRPLRRRPLRRRPFYRWLTDGPFIDGLPAVTAAGVRPINHRQASVHRRKETDFPNLCALPRAGARLLLRLFEGVGSEVTKGARSLHCSASLLRRRCINCMCLNFDSFSLLFDFAPLTTFPSSQIGSNKGSSLAVKSLVLESGEDDEDIEKEDIGIIGFYVRALAKLQNVPRLVLDSGEDDEYIEKEDIDVISFYVRRRRGLRLHELACLAFLLESREDDEDIEKEDIDVISFYVRAVAKLQNVLNLVLESGEDDEDIEKEDIDVISFYIRRRRGLRLHELACLAFCRARDLTPFLLT
ncbi:hypothetical protein MA16_Dca021296 [Dendrobium catenatum]|uniref:Uncharacterized protein n=1 Tax=Dendrobium catenatum TaxID=906689 RepID=A0A2I0XHG4_9ASPA|nr:hypothetical protein MA16_Dca021296 [Dendrobium catenatum]